MSQFLLNHEGHEAHEEKLRDLRGKKIQFVSYLLLLT